MEKKVKITEKITIGQNDFFFIGGPCVIENKKMVFLIAQELKKITDELNIHFIFKASYDKANRSSIKSFRGVGIKNGLKILSDVKEKLKIPVLTDVHTEKEVDIIKKVVDVIQIPAFLCRQTDLILQAARTKKTINIKKGQFLSPYEMQNIIDKVKSVNNDNILLTERGFSFGYNNLVVDMRAIAIIKETGYPVIIDATHSVQKPGGARNKSSGEREFVETIAKAAIAAGANGVFMEVHHDIKNALSDKDTQIPVEKVKSLLIKLKKIFDATNE